MDKNENINGFDEEIPLTLAHKLSNLPAKPGIYQFKNDNDKIIYIGKAKNLRNRVRSYFQNKRPVDAKTKALIAKIDNLEIIVVDSEAEALILEDTLIKKHKPRYNILLRDDKSFPYIRITNEQYPKIFPTRQLVRDGSKYFGPYTEVRQMKHLLRVLRSVFLFRTCDLALTDAGISKNKFKVCLDYHIKKCDGPCIGMVARDFYNEKIRQAIQIINGKTRDLEKFLEEQMQTFASEMKFEEAAQVRNKLAALKDYTEKQKIVTTELIDRDIFGFARIEKNACSLVFTIRDGKLTGKRHFIISNTDDQDDQQIILRTIEKWYLENEFIPKEIFLPFEIDDLDYLLDWLGKKRGRSIEVHIPRIGDKKKLVALADSNAEFVLREYLLSVAKRDQMLPNPVLSLQRDLRLPKPPVRIECFDNSHIQGSELVSSMVVFQSGKPKKSDYRKFKIQTVGKNDDFAAMQEVITRRYSRLINENQPLPDLIIIDGGKGQLSHAVEILKKLAIFNKVQVIGLAKRLEEVFFPGVSESLLLPRTSSSLKLIQQIRDEAHRFAITFHRNLRDKRTLQTELTNISGIGEKTAQKLLIEFGSVQSVREADIEQLESFVGKKNAHKLKLYFSEQKPTVEDESAK
jgi:excinuclease ABC subunit C